MSARRHFAGWLALLALGGLACGIFSPLSLLSGRSSQNQTQQQQQATIMAAVQATLTAAAPISGPEATAQPPGPAASATPAPSPTPEPRPGPHPAYVWAYEEDANRYVLYDAHGHAVFTWTPPDGVLQPRSILHLDGPVPSDGNWTGRRVFYWGVFPGGQGLSAVELTTGTQHSYSQIGETGVDIFLVNLAGYAAAPQVAMSLLYAPGRQYESRLFLVDPLASSDVVSLLETMVHPNGRVLSPVGVSAAGVWYTYAMWGAPVLPHGLALRSDPTSATTLLDDEHTLLAFEPGLGLVVESPATGQIAWRAVDLVAGTWQGPVVQIADPLLPQEAMPIAAAAGSRYVAWRVHVGPFLEGASYLRVYTWDGQAVAVEMSADPPPALAGLQGGFPRAWLEPDADTAVLVLEGRSAADRSPVLALVTADLNSPAVIVPGVFAGVAYAP